MADFTPQESGKKTNTRNKPIHVDMTPMVDLGFLLITFFMLATSFLKPNIMDLGLPAKGNETTSEIDFRNQLTFIIGNNDRVFYYQKSAKDLKTSDIHETTLSGMEMISTIQKYKQKAPKPDSFTILIKPTKEANYKNFVDILDNLAIAKSERYGIADLKPSEEKIVSELTK